MTSSAWSVKDEAFIKRYWGKKSTEEIAAAVKRSTNAVQKKAQRLGIGYINPFAAAPKVASKPKPKPASKPEPKPVEKPLSKKEVDAILHKATAPRPPTVEEAKADLQSALETVCHALANHPLTKRRCEVTLGTWRLLDALEGF